MSKNLGTKIRETKDLGARRCGFTRPSLPRLWSRDFIEGARSDVTMGLWIIALQQMWSKTGNVPSVP